MILRFIWYSNCYHEAEVATRMSNDANKRVIKPHSCDLISGACKI